MKTHIQQYLEQNGRHGPDAGGHRRHSAGTRSFARVEGAYYRTLRFDFTLLSFLFLIPNRAVIRSDGNRAKRQAELKALIPARAPVEKERIETEFRTASGITNGSGKFIAGVVLITAGYAAEGKYSNFLIVQSAMKIGSVELKPGEYVFGWRRKDDESLEVKIIRLLTPGECFTANVEARSV